jgi:hypothetical protein
MTLINDVKELLTREYLIKYKLVVITSLLVLTTVITVLDSLTLTVTTLAIVVTLYIMRYLRDFILMVKVFTVFILPFITSSLTIQLFLGTLDVSRIISSTLKMFLLYILSITLIKLITFKDLLSMVKYLGLKPVLIIVLGFRVVNLGITTLNDITSIYNVNLGSVCRGFKRKLILIKLVTQAFIQSFIVRILDMEEVMYCRYRSVIKRLGG